MTNSETEPRFDVLDRLIESLAGIERDRLLAVRRKLFASLDYAPGPDIWVLRGEKYAEWEKDDAPYHLLSELDKAEYRERALGFAWLNWSSAVARWIESQYENDAVLAADEFADQWRTSAGIARDAAVARIMAARSGVLDRKADSPVEQPDAPERPRKDVAGLMDALREEAVRAGYGWSIEQFGPESEVRLEDERAGIRATFSDPTIIGACRKALRYLESVT